MSTRHVLFSAGQPIAVAAQEELDRLMAIAQRLTEKPQIFWKRSSGRLRLMWQDGCRELFTGVEIAPVPAVGSVALPRGRMVRGPGGVTRWRRC